MRKQIGVRHFLHFLFLFLCASCFIASAQTRPSATEPASVAASAIPRATGEYAGGERCRACHRAEVLQYEKTKHASLPAVGKDSAQGCEMCHGPGKAHADAMSAARGDDAATEAAKKLIFSFNANPKKNAEVCMQCHKNSRTQSAFNHSAHANHGVGCNDCHVTHLVLRTENPRRVEMATAQQEMYMIPKLPEEQRWLHNSLLKTPQPDLCFGCHGNIRAQFALPTHHRVPEGNMKCTDCHNTHGTSNRATLRQSGWETCVQCHVEKRGPFVFEHSAVKVEGCTACHTPHGSVNRMLLVRREERFLCLQCHVNPVSGSPGAVNVPHGRLGYQTRGDCTRCHVAIHGSNFNEFLLH